MPAYDPRIHHRRSIRLRGYDYSQAGAYFVTIVAWKRDMLFGDVVDGEMKLNRCGETVQKWWDDIPVHFPDVQTGAFVIMPNHIHGIIIIEGRGAVPAPTIIAPTIIAPNGDGLSTD
jgi:REP element-mobilizing transposase RayT